MIMGLRPDDSKSKDDQIYYGMYRILSGSLKWQKWGWRNVSSLKGNSFTIFHFRVIIQLSYIYLYLYFTFKQYRTVTVPYRKY